MPSTSVTRQVALPALLAIAIEGVTPGAALLLGVRSPVILALCALAGALLAAGLVASLIARAFAPVGAAVQGLSAVAADLAQNETFSRAQHNLDRNITLLREGLFTLGEPRQVGDALYFGSTRIDGDYAVVDRVREQAGGTATVFLGDLRVSTNVTKPDGARAVGTRLAAGPVYEAVLGRGKGYRGEAEILGETYFTIYEPILSEGRVIGIIYVGVKKAQFMARPEAALDADTGGDPVERASAAVAALRSVATAQADGEREAIDRRMASDNARREQDMRWQQGVAKQREVVETLSDVLQRLASGDLSRRVEREVPPEYAALRDNLNTAISALQDIIGGVAEGCGSLRRSAGEISHAADSLSQRTEHQAASLEETASALNEITATVKSTADGARRTNQLVADTRARVDGGSVTMGEAVQAMDQIQDSSRRISSIIGVMDEIAFQTNLLALNAGVEAARAGEMGRGFAVVASEVRALAQRSATAAKEVKTLIDESARHVEQGADSIGRTQQALQAVASQVVEIDQIVAEIAASAREQASGLDQINTAINDMDRVTQQNAAMVEESTAATHDLAQETERLAELIGRFRTTTSAETRRAAA
jgi:methyl-accepting chemotaxis protein